MALGGSLKAGRGPSDGMSGACVLEVSVGRSWVAITPV